MHVPTSRSICTILVILIDIYSVCSAAWYVVCTCHVRTGPSDSPQNVSHGSLSDSSVQLFWSPPPLDNQTESSSDTMSIIIVNANNTIISRALELSVRLTTKILWKKSLLSGFGYQP